MNATLSPCLAAWTSVIGTVSTDIPSLYTLRQARFRQEYDVEAVNRIPTSAIGAAPAVLAFSLARSRWRMYSGARPRKSRANTRTAQAMTPLSMPTLGPGGDFNRTASRIDPKPSRPAIGAASVY